MYQRNERADWLINNGGRFCEELGIFIDCEYARMSSLKRYAELFPDDFLYVDDALYSPDMKIAYAYAVDGSKIWRMPDSVEIYDNIFFTGNGEELYSLKEVYIGKNLKMIIDTYACFGMDLQEITVSPQNSFYASVKGCLYTKNKKELICYPPMHKTKQFTIPKGTEIIKKYAIVVNLLPSKLVIPDCVKVIEKGWLMEQYDKGYSWTRKQVLKATKIEIPYRFKENIDEFWAEESYERPTIHYY